MPELGVRRVSHRLTVFVWICLALLADAGPRIAVAQDDDSLNLILEFLNDNDKETRSLALTQIATDVKGEAATKKFAELLPTLAPDRQVELLSALAARKDKAAAPAVRELLASSQDEKVGLAAIEAIGWLGGEGDVPAIVKSLDSKSEAEQQAARGTLERLPGEPPSAAILNELKNAKSTPLAVTLIEILTARRAASSIGELLTLAKGADPERRAAAMTALGAIAQAEHIQGMVSGVLEAKPGSERAAAERTIVAVCQRLSQGDDRAAPLLAAMEQLDAKDKLALYSTLGRVGGKDALNVVEEAITADDEKLHDAGMVALCNWPDGTVAPRLLELARTEAHDNHRTMARKALIRIAPLPDGRSDERRLDLLRTALAMAQDDAERKQILERAKAIRTVESLRLIKPYMEQPMFKEVACLTAVELAHHSKLREAHREEFLRTLDKVIATSKDATVVDRAQRYKKGQTWVRPKTPAKS
jgi:hypothetical protein